MKSEKELEKPELADSSNRNVEAKVIIRNRKQQPTSNLNKLKRLSNPLTNLNQISSDESSDGDVKPKAKKRPLETDLDTYQRTKRDSDEIVPDSQKPKPKPRISAEKQMSMPAAIDSDQDDYYLADDMMGGAKNYAYYGPQCGSQSSGAKDPESPRDSLEPKSPTEAALYLRDLSVEANKSFDVGEDKKYEFDGNTSRPKLRLYLKKRNSARYGTRRSPMPPRRQKRSSSLNNAPFTNFFGKPNDGKKDAKKETKKAVHANKPRKKGERRANCSRIFFLNFLLEFSSHFSKHSISLTFDSSVC